MTNHADRMARHHFFAVLVLTGELNAQAVILICRGEFNNCDIALNGVTGKDRALKFEQHLARNEVHITAQFGGYRRGQESVHH